MIQSSPVWENVDLILSLKSAGESINLEKNEYS